ncbi:MAG TPA: ATP-binding protein [Ktedonobacterales bacterium]|jgi:predicted ATP-dependent protease|nr:ATP-binding protein [Ktedonobacterales bacterium]
MQRPSHPLELQPQDLRRRTNSASLGFQTTRDLPAPEGMVGQDRALEAIDFALEIQDSRYNLFVAGPPGSGRLTAVTTAVERIARQRRAPQDWCYVYSFEQPEEPRVIPLPPGKGREFARDIDAFIDNARREMRRAFSSDSTRQKRDTLLKDLEEERKTIIASVKRDGRTLGFLLEFGPSSVAIQPARPASGERDDGEQDTLVPLTDDDFQRLSPQEREALESRRRSVEGMLDQAAPQLHALDEEENKRLRTLERETAEATVQPLADELAGRYAVSADALDFIRLLARDVIAQSEILRTGDDPVGADSAVTSSAAPDEWLSAPGGPSALTTLLHRYRVNVICAHREDDHAPVVHEINPTRANLVGWQEFGTHEGRPFTDHMMIKPGALHRANGGFLVLQANDLLRAPNAWDALKRVLRFETISLDGGEPQGPVGASQRPEPIPAAVRVALIGDRGMYFGLAEADPEFRQLFKVRADFDVEMPRNAATEQTYARYAGNVARTTGGAPLSAEAVALLIEEGSRWIERQDRLATLFGELRELTVEACYRARRAKSEITTGEHMRQAIEARERRLSILADKDEQEIEEGRTFIQTEGAVVGQVNALTVASSGDYSFSKPTRITVRTAPGQVGVIDVEREVALGGSFHSKGVLILSGYLRGRYAQEFPLSLSASLAFEQTYGGVDGDSASSSELYALLSSLSGVPIKQNLAVTGSVNQLGEIQPVGSVTEKVEGFFTVCQKRGLRDDQGVIIPRASITSLMLRDDVIEAVRAGKFHIYAIATVDEGIELLTGIPAGQPDKNGRYLEGTINARVLRTLRTYSERMRAYYGANGR